MTGNIRCLYASGMYSVRLFTAGILLRIQHHDYICANCLVWLAFMDVILWSDWLVWMELFNLIGWCGQHPSIWFAGMDGIKHWVEHPKMCYKLVCIYVCEAKLYNLSSCMYIIMYVTSVNTAVLSCFQLQIFPYEHRNTCCHIVLYHCIGVGSKFEV